MKISRRVLDFVTRRLRLALGRFSADIRTVTVKLTQRVVPEDKNAYKCVITIGLAPAGHLRVENTGDDLVTAVIQAAERSGRAVSRSLNHRRELGAPTTRSRHHGAGLPGG